MSFICFILIIYTKFIVSFCCSCHPLNVTQSFCKSNFVAHVKIVNVTCANLSDPHQDLEYGVEHIKFYKQNPTFSTVKYKNVIHTGRNKDVCGIEFDIHSTNPNETNWIIFGSICHREAYASTCSASTRWNSDTIQKLEHSSKINCTSLLETEETYQPERTTNPTSEEKSTKSVATFAVESTTTKQSVQQPLDNIEDFILSALSYHDIIVSQNFRRRFLYLL